MHSTIAQESFICSRCLAKRNKSLVWTSLRHGRRTFTSGRRKQAGGENAAPPPGSEKGAMSRRLEAMTEQSLEEGGRGARKAVEEAGFSEELKKQLEARIASGQAKQLDTTASTVLGMPAAAGPTTRDIALARPWTGTESVEDASLRMLQDAHKPLRGDSGRRSRIATPKLSSMSVDTRLKQAARQNRGERIANARDKTSIYAITQDPNLSEKEKEEMRKIMREKFQPGARPMPTTIQGLASLANERIEDAIARGQFKNIPRGKGVGKKVDHNANSPFINTTEYFMNKMIQRQDIVPPWIEKQQEVVKTASAFRARLRNDWKRHAARTISSKGGSLIDQLRRAEAYAVAEAELNPKTQRVEAISQVDDTGQLSQINIVETPSPDTDSVDTKISVVETPLGHVAAEVAANVAATTSVPTDPSQDGTKHLPVEPRPSVEAPNTATPLEERQTAAPEPSAPSPRLTLPPFRDPNWEKIELPYHSAVLKELNSLTRSYNLMAPELAKKPYYNLERELRNCYADVAPQLAGEIKERARRPERIKVEIVGHKPGSVLERFGGETAKVYDSRKPNYGFKEFWQELWRKEDERRA